MANLCQPSHALLFVCSFASLVFSSHTANDIFSIPPISDTIINCTNDAYHQPDKLQLTKNQATGRLTKSFGWAVYDKSVPLWDASTRCTLANFSTDFQFVIQQGNNHTISYGDGLTFFMAPFDLEPPEDAYGGGLGLFNATNYFEPFYQMVAVEFDTYQNDWDPDDNHVGIDFSGIMSEANVSLNFLDESYKLCNKILKNGNQWHAWVDYDGGAKKLQVFLYCNVEATSISKPEMPILSYDIDLREALPDNIKVGLSASTGDAAETHTVSAWNFSYAYSCEISPAPSPAINTSPGEHNPSKGKKKNKISPAPSPAINTSPGEHNPSKGKKKKKNSVKVVAISVLCGVLGLGVFMFFVWWWKNRRPGEEGEESDVELDEWFSQGPRNFSYAELSTATRNFSEEEKLGQGGFGGVYKGTLPGTAEVVAVKRISEGSKQGRKEYISEVSIISNLRHRNLVQLLGWCHQKEELLLVYEYLPNGSLDKYIFGEESEDTLDWDRRYSIACDIASALVYLHEEWDQRVVHRDVKASNVMLDSDFNAKLGDFGLARLVERDQAASHTTVVAGTLGYLAPECYITGKASPEADVYSFGAVMLEIACGRRPVDHTLVKHNSRLVEWVWDLYGQGKLLDGADGKLGGDFNHKEIELLMLVGLLCSHPDPISRPRMREVLKILKREAELPCVPLDLPVAVYSQPVNRRDGTSGSWSSGPVSSSSVREVSTSSLNASVLSSSTASSGSVKICSPLLYNTGPY